MEYLDDNCIVLEQPVVSHQNFLLLDEMRREGKFCDVTLKVKELSLRAHKVILSAGIPYFHAMFTSNMLESEMSEVVLHEIEGESLEALINYVYTGKIIIDITTVQSLMLGASYLQLTQILNACENFLGNRLYVHKVIGTKKFAALLNCKTLVKTCKEFIEMHFHEVSSCDEYLELTAEELDELLSSNKLAVHDESLVFEALMRWIKKDPERRETHLLHLLRKVRLPLINLQYLVNTVAKEELIKSSHECRNLIDEVKDYYLLPKGSVIKSFSSQHRYNAIGGQIFVVGGINDKFETMKTVESFNSKKGGWSLTTPMTTAIAGLAVAVVNNSLYAIGEDYNYRDQTRVARFDVYTQKWFQEPSMPRRKIAMGAAALGSKIYACGGSSGSRSLETVDCFDVKSGMWTSAEPMITRRSSCAVVALNGYLYALGGHVDQFALDLVERYDPKTKQWTKVTPMLTKRSTLGAAALNGKLYACGGFDGSTSLKTVEVYDPKHNKWQMVAPMNTKRSKFGVAAIGGKLWAIGGSDGQFHLSTVEIYNPFFNKWTFGQPLSECRSDFGVGVIDCS